ncbi:MAG: preprotein translocase subunit SecG [Candidatus Euphemobacter frigidus]|nr:preprotein translocase subunit SecG [Candidatus Euphemobacter frigidus]MDP8275883.1 preprotein translocase subunit SecG [Candidatus Euphemobacter frigidus]
MLFTVLIVLYVVICIALIVVVLLQSGKGGGLAGIFGSGGGGQTIFGARAGDIMTKSTTVLAICFMIFSLVLAFLSSRQMGSLAKEVEAVGLETPESPPAVPSGEESAGTEVKEAPPPADTEGNERPQ